MHLRWPRRARGSLSTSSAELGPDRPVGVDQHYQQVQPVDQGWRDLRLPPPSVISYCSLSSLAANNCFRWALSRDNHKSPSEYSLKGSRFILNEPENNTGSCRDISFVYGKGRCNLGNYGQFFPQLVQPHLGDILPVDFD